MAERRRRDLTPLSGELTSREWRPPARRRRLPRLRRGHRPPPKTWREAIFRGVLRFTFILVLLAALALALGFLLVAASGMDAERAVPIAFFVVGATLMAAAVFASSPIEGPYMTQVEREGTVSSSLVYVAFGLALVGVGVALDASGVLGG